MNEIVIDTLSPLQIPLFYIDKPDTPQCKNIKEYITFSFERSEEWHSDNKAECDAVTVNLTFVTENIEKVDSVLRNMRRLLNESDTFYNVKSKPTKYNNTAIRYTTLSTCEMLCFLI